MKVEKAKRWTKDGKEDHKSLGLVEGGSVSLDEKLEVPWLTFGAEFPGLKEDQFKWAFDHNTKVLKCEELGTRNLRHVARFRI